MKGFTLLPVVLAMSLVAAIAYLLNRDNAVNTNLIGAESDRERARYAAEAGLQAVNYNIQGLGCAGSYPIASSPVTDSNFGGAVYSSHANNTTGSPLTLTSTGTYNGASVTLTKANAYVYQPFQPGTTPPWVTQPGPATGKDAYVEEDQPTHNHSSENDLEIDRDEKQTLIAFNLSPLPAGSRIVRSFYLGLLRPGATISLYQGDWDANQSFLVKLITHDWVTGSVTFNRWDGISIWPQGFGNGYDPRTLTVVPEPPAGWVDIDITDAAVGWTSGVYPNYGLWLLGPNNSTRDYRFRSSNYTGDSTKRPKLTAYYLLPCGTAAPPDVFGP